MKKCEELFWMTVFIFLLKIIRQYQKDADHRFYSRFFAKIIKGL